MDKFITKDEVVQLLGIDEANIEGLSELIQALHELSVNEGVSDIAFVDDIVNGHIDAEILEVVNVKGEPIAILDYFGRKTNMEEVIEDLSKPLPVLYQYVRPAAYDKSEGLFQVINYDKESDTVEIEQMAVIDGEPFTLWVHVSDLRIIE